MERIRQAIDRDAGPLRKILASRSFKRHFGELSGEAVKTAPKGFKKTHPDIDLIRKKQFLVKKAFTDEQVTSPRFIANAVASYRAMRPFFDYMSDILTYDADGQPRV